MTRNRLFLELGGGFAAIAVTVGCTTTPAFTRERMTLGEAGITGLECRREQELGSTFKKTICAKPEDWKKLDDKQRRETDLVFDIGRSGQNTNHFNRGN
ncbi:MAG TPA: hypothetical protein VG942_01955 [Hyphomonadaceae bacterium]|nr:hypothetical protein [Hyphomonadaceae bacterium]